MNLLSLPAQLIHFWYPEATRFFKTTLKNGVLYLEEDLAVGLMWRLLWQPLFHDNSLVGHVLSIGFRLARILLGAAAMAGIAGSIFLLALGWYLLPFLVLYFVSAQTWWAIAMRLIFFSAIALFLIQKVQQWWSVRPFRPEKLSFAWLLQQSRVQDLCHYLELDLHTFAGFLETVKVSKKDWQAANKIPQVDQVFVTALVALPGLEQQLEKQQLKPSDLQEAVDFLSLRDAHWRMFALWDDQFQVKHLKGVNRGWLSAPTPTLDQVAQDLTLLASKEQQEDFIGRPLQVKQIIDDLSLNQGRNVLIVGEPGTGKTTLLHHLAKTIVAGDAPSTLATKRLVQLDTNALLSGVTNQGELAQRLKTIFDQVRFSGQVIICLEEITELGVGQAAHDYNLYALLLPYLESNDLQFIATTEPDNYRRVLEKDASFARVFHKVDLPAATQEETLAVLKIRAIETQRQQKISYTLPALHTLVDLAARFRQDRVLPDSALQVFQEVQPEAVNGWVTKALVEKVFQADTHLPIVEASTDQKLQLLHLEEVIHQRYIDQQLAVEAVANALRRNAAHLRDEHHPVGTFLFVGPTGVGKTELCKALAEVFFDGQMTRFDMSEYQTTDSIDRLTEGLAKHPYNVLLFDEFEKADPKVLNLFLPMLDEGRLTTTDGKTLDLTNTIMVATSNAGSVLIAEGLKDQLTMEKIRENLNQELLKTFHPELLNRFDEVVIFQSLTPQDLVQVVRLKLNKLQQQLEKQGFNIEFTQDLVESLAERGYDPVMGARPLERLIQDTLEAKLSTMILSNGLQKGSNLHLDKHFLE